jgi:hypothetical protein
LLKLNTIREVEPIAKIGDGNLSDSFGGTGSSGQPKVPQITVHLANGYGGGSSAQCSTTQFLTNDV